MGGLTPLRFGSVQGRGVVGVIEIFRQLSASATMRSMENVEKSEKWTKVVFHATDAVQVIETGRDGKQIHGIRKLKSGEQLASDVVVVKNGWDHEHCEVCWTHINPGDDAYRNERDHWLCLDCFAKDRGAK